MYADLAVLCRHIRQVEKSRLAAELQLGAFRRVGIFDGLDEATSPYVKRLAQLEAALKRRLVPAAAGEPWLDAVATFATRTVGLGPTVLYVIGLIPPLVEFANPAKVWRYLGLHVLTDQGCTGTQHRPVSGRAARAVRGERMGFSLFLRALALQRIADPIVKHTSSPYRALYDQRKAHTLGTHPPMTDECATCQLARQRTREDRAQHAYTRERTAVGRDCANVGGIHWTDGHRHRDAMRYVAKRVWRDVWRIAQQATKASMEPISPLSPALAVVAAA